MKGPFIPYILGGGTFFFNNVAKNKQKIKQEGTPFGENCRA